MVYGIPRLIDHNPCATVVIYHIYIYQVRQITDMHIYQISTWVLYRLVNILANYGTLKQVLIEISENTVEYSRIGSIRLYKRLFM